MVGGGHKEVLHQIVGPERCPTHALATPSLCAVLIRARALGVAARGDRDDHLFLGDEVLDRDVAVKRADLGAAVVAVLAHDLGELVADDGALATLVGEDSLQVLDLGHERGVIVGDLLALERGEAAQLQVEDRGGLHLVNVEQLHEPHASRVCVGRAANERDDLVKCVERLEVADQDVGFALGFTQAISSPTLDHLKLVRGPVTDEAVERKRARNAVDDREHVRAEGVLQLRVLVEVVEHDLGDGVALEHDLEALTRAARRLVANVRDARDLAVLDEVNDLDRQIVGVHLVRQLGDDQAHPSLDLLDVHHGAHRDEAAARAVRVFDALAAKDGRAGGEVRALDALHERLEQLLLRRLGVVEVPLHASGHLPQVVRGNVRGHTHGDTGRTVNQQVGETRRKDDGFLLATVVVGLKVHGVFVDVPHQLHGERGHLALGVPRGGGAVVASGAEVALAGDERIAQRPRLHHADDRVVDGAVPMGVVLTHDVADDARALGERAVWTVATVEHRVQDAAVDGLEPVTNVGKRAANDDGHRVVQVGPLHFGVEVYGLDAAVLNAAGDVRCQGNAHPSHCAE